MVHNRSEHLLTLIISAFFGMRDRLKKERKVESTWKSLSWRKIGKGHGSLLADMGGFSKTWQCQKLCRAAKRMCSCVFSSHAWLKVQWFFCNLLPKHLRHSFQGVTILWIKSVFKIGKLDLHRYVLLKFSNNFLDTVTERSEWNHNLSLVLQRYKKQWCTKQKEEADS